MANSLKLAPKSSHLEAAFETYWQVFSCGRYSGYEREHRFARHLGRRFAFDFAWVQQRVAVELEGGTWSGGRHTRGAGYENDCKKYNLAVLEGWAVLRFTSTMLNEDPQGAVLAVLALLEQRSGNR